MFGYIKPLSAELLLKEYELYKAVYCGLCRTGGKTVSRFTRFLLSYDFTALATLRLALTENDPRVEKRRCPYSLKKKNMLVCEDVFTYTCAAFALLCFAKAEDDVRDEKGAKRFKKRLAMPILKRMKRKADRLFPKLYGELDRELLELGRLEKDTDSHRLDEYAHHAATALAIIAKEDLEGTDAAIAYDAAYHIGRYIYILDAVDDLAEDAKKKRFNPLIKHYGSMEKAVEQMEEIDATLKASGVRFSASVGLIKSSIYTDILQNIARFGMTSVAKEVYDKYGYKRKENEDL